MIEILPSETSKYEQLSDHYIAMANRYAKLAEKNGASGGINIKDVAYSEELAEHFWKTAAGIEPTSEDGWVGSYVCSLAL